MKKQDSRVIHMAEEAETKLQKKNRWSKAGKWLGSLLLLWLELIMSVRIFLEMFPINRRVDSDRSAGDLLVDASGLCQIQMDAGTVFGDAFGDGRLSVERMAVGLARGFSAD